MCTSKLKLLQLAAASSSHDVCPSKNIYPMHVYKTELHVSVWPFIVYNRIDSF